MRVVDQSVTLSVPQLLVSAIERLAGAHTKEDVVEILRRTSRALAGADGICIVMRDHGRCFYIEEDAINPLWKGGKFPMETCISGWAMINRETVVIPDVFLDDRIPHAIYKQTFVKSLVMIPIGRDEPIAALGAYWSRNYTAPKEVVETLEALARAAATALENAYLIGALSSSLQRTELARDDLRHRLANALGAIDTYGEMALPKDLARGLSKRVAALSRAHDLLDEKMELDATMLVGDLVAAELDPYRMDMDERIDVSGPEIRISGAQAIALGLALNELAANSARGGALKSTAGAIKVSWRELDRVVTLEWQEIDRQTAQRGIVDNLNSQMVKRLVSSQLNGMLRGHVADGAVTCVIEFPNDAAIAFPQTASVA